MISVIVAGHPYDDDYETHFDVTFYVNSLDEAKEHAFDSLAPQFNVKIMWEAPDNKTPVLSRWSAAKEVWMDCPKNIAKAFNLNVFGHDSN